MGEGLSHWSSMVLRKSQTCFSDRHTHPNSMYSNFCHVLKTKVIKYFVYFTRNKDIILFNIKNTSLHFFNLILLNLQRQSLYTLYILEFKVLLYLKNEILSVHSSEFLQLRRVQFQTHRQLPLRCPHSYRLMSQQI